MKDIYDDDTIKLKAKVSGTPLAVRKIKEVKFHVTVKKGDQETTESPISAPVTVAYPESSAEHDYKLKKVDDNLDNYELKYRAEITPPGKASTWADGDEEYRIWPKEVSVTFTSDKDDVHKKAKFKTKSGNKTSPTRNADDQGKWEGTIGKKKWTVEVEPPYALVDPVHDGRARTYKIEKEPYELEIVSPRVLDATQTIKQYVNLDTDPAGWSEQKPFGNKVSFTIGAQGDTARSAQDRLAKQDDIVHVEVNFTPKTKRNDPQPCLVRNAQFVAAPADSNSKKTWKGQVKMNADGQAVFEVELGFAGGDTCEVKVGTDDTVGGPKLKFENARKVFYELMYPDFMEADLQAAGGLNFDFAANLRNLVTARLGAAYVEYELVASHSYPEADAPQTGVVKSAAYMGLAGRNRMIMGSKLPSADPTAFGAANVRTIHIKVADLALSTGGGSKEAQNPQLRAVEFEFQNADRDYFIPLEVDVAGCRWEAVIPDPNAYKAFPALTVPNDQANVTTADASDGVIKIQDDLHNVPEIELDFPNPRLGHRPANVPRSERTKITDFLDAVMTVPHLRADNRVVLSVVAQNDNNRRRRRANNAIAAIKQAFETKKTNLGKIPNHPGLKDDGTARSGEVKAEWFTEYRSTKLKIQLPTSGDGSEPGDFVGPLGADKCNIRVPFSVWVVYAINGNSGSGEQLFVLDADRTPGALASTLCHELGHAMGMTIWIGSNAVYSSKSPPGMDAAKHVDSAPAKGPYYRRTFGAHGNNFGMREIGVGPHCASGIPQGDWTHGRFNDKDGTCVMFSSGGDADTRPAYCATCKEYLTGRKLVDITSNWKDRADEDF